MAESPAKQWASACARTLARRLRRQRQAECGFTRASALACRTAAFRAALKQHWWLCDAAGAHFAHMADALEATRLLRALPDEVLAESQSLKDAANWARHSPPPDAQPRPPRLPSGALHAPMLEEFRDSLYSDPGVRDMDKSGLTKQPDGLHGIQHDAADNAQDEADREEEDAWDEYENAPWAESNLKAVLDASADVPLQEVFHECLEIPEDYFHRIAQAPSEEDVYGEEVEEVSAKEKHGDLLMGAKLRRTVDGTVFDAVVVDIERGAETKQKLYLVEYSDGDREHLTEHQCLESLVPDTPAFADIVMTEVD